MRLQLSNDHSLVDLDVYQNLEREVHEAELLHANILRKRSRLRWIKEGEACSKYFFKCLKSKQEQERLSALAKDDGTIVEDVDKLLEVIHTFYQDLYSQPRIREEDREERSQVLHLIGRGLSDDDNGQLDRLPAESEVDDLVNSLAKEKAPARLKKLIPELVDEDQIGFVDGRSIMDINVMNLKLCQDLVNTTNEAAIFCKLDFKKVFDRVQHNFLWDLLAKMNFSQHFISFIRMLISGGRAKVHVNGRFTQTIKLEGG
ncbi:hypothetical protein R1sor_024474 [Riccia sorocarpa]|uniref:Reverse transcriptase domain-containing protein n=1 Tax=Riccia sorocarpa TaxID=122646 RepID=A0ABD3GRE2_9MARC